MVGPLYNNITRKDLNQLANNQQTEALPVIKLLTELFSLPINALSKPVMFDNSAYFLAMVKEKKQASVNLDTVTEAKKYALDLLKYDLFLSYQNYLLKN